MKKAITITGINVKSGTTTQGKEYARYGFYDGEQWFNFWAADWNVHLQNAAEGDTVEICFIKTEFKGKPQYEIINPLRPEVVEEEKKENVIKELQEAMVKLEGGVIKEFQDAIRKLENRLEIVEARMDEIEEAKGG